MEWVQNAVETQYDYLDHIARDWGYWDDTYEFVQTLDPEYIDSNLGNESMLDLEVNLFLFVNASGDIVYSKYVDLNTGETVPLPGGVEEMIKGGSFLVESEKDSVRGVVLFDEMPVLLASRPILRSDHEGPAEGTLILGRCLDDEFVGSIEDVTRSSLLVSRMDREMPSDFQAVFPETSDKVVILPSGEDTISAYFVLDGVDGKPVVMIRQDLSRDLYAHGQKILYYLYFLLLATGIVMGMGSKILLDSLFISRLGEIDDFVDRVRKEKDLSKRLKIKGEDELYRLSAGINGMLDDISLAGKEIKTRDAEKRTILDSLNEMLIFLDTDFRVVWANKAALQHMGVKLDDALGFSQQEATGISGRVFRALELEETLSGRTKSGEFASPDGKLWFIQAIPVKDEAGKIIGILETCLNITERKKAEKFLHEKELAETASRTKSEFLANMSHELRTPLNSIIGFSDLLIEQLFGELNEKQLRYVNNISKNGKHLLSLINDLLDFSKIEAGKMELNYEEFSLQETLAEIKSLMSPIASEKEIEINIDVDPEIPEIRADRNKFIQVMENLLSNAIKFSPRKGTIEVNGALKGNMVWIGVRDEGIGIEKEGRERLFKPFSQIDSFAAKKYQGTGLGLVLVKKIVQLHGGHVWFESEAGKGSTFGFSIPLKTGKKES
ncbi:CHASE4 domain-containing protein [Methanosarcina sp. Mfa9]|uniref:CHASE4 domain-containing protein n=1 Tax=Methanosarcina sp. Mfa9 TaxID=3439063 RepID=UPI003F830A7B